MDHSRGHGQHTPAPPQPTPTPQRRRIERSGPPHPPRPIPPPPRPTPPRPTTPGPPSSSPDAGSVGRHGTRGDSSPPPNHLPPVQKRPRPTEGNTLPTQRTLLPSTPPPARTTEAPGGLGVFSGRSPGRPRRGHRNADGPHGPGNLRQRPQDEPPRGTPLAHLLPVAPTGTGGFTRPRHPPGQEDQDRSGGPPTRPPAGRDAPTKARVQPHHTTPRPDPRDTPTTPPPPVKGSSGQDRTSLKACVFPRIRFVVYCYFVIKVSCSVLGCTDTCMLHKPIYYPVALRCRCRFLGTAWHACALICALFSFGKALIFIIKRSAFVGM